MDITQFFNDEQSRKFNADALPAPAEYADWETNNTTLLKYFNWIREESRCASLRLDINAPVDDVAVELIQRALPLAIPHRAGQSKGWKTVTLHGLSSIMSDNSAYYKEEKIVDQDAVETWTDVSKFFPKTVEWIRTNIPLDSYSRVRVMILEPGGVIEPHRDWRGQMLGGGINVAITNPDGVEFGLENGGLVPWRPGDVRMIDVARHHSVRNHSNVPRIHLIVSPPGITWNYQAMRLACRSYDIFGKTIND